MLHDIGVFVLSFPMTGYMGALLYFFPMIICFYGYTIRTWNNYQKDIFKRDISEENKFYHPTDTVGSIIGRAIVSILPFANILAAVFDVAPKIISSFFNSLEKIFNQPLVPPRQK